MSTLQKALDLAEDLQHKITNNMDNKEKVFHEKMKKLLENPKNKLMLIELLDISFRTSSRGASFETVSFILDKYGLGDFFSTFDKFLLLAFLSVGKISPSFSIPFFIDRLRKETKDLVLDEDPNILHPHIQMRRQQNITLNLNLVGEQVLGDKQSEVMLEKYEAAIKSKEITYISIKITTIFAKISHIDFEYSKNEIVKRLDRLYKLALEEQKKQGQDKFINLDMEEYQDVELTAVAFKESISKFGELTAGIVLQSYIPDSYEYLKDLFNFSKERVNAGQKPIKIRFVKGANMESEQIIAAQRGWELPTFNKKIDTDTNYNKMLDFVLENDNFKYLQVGIATHNIFEVAYAYVKIKEANALDSFSFEMLEGMSMQCSYELSKLHKVILYAPVCGKEHFNNAIAYLVRRLDENTSDDNFMRYFFDLKVDDKNYVTQKKLFEDSLNNKIDNSVRRTQNRYKKDYDSTTKIIKTDKFYNEQDTDFTRKVNRQWAQEIKEKYKNLQHLDIYPVIGELTADKMTDKTKKLEIYDKIENKLIATAHLATEELIKEALKTAINSTFSKLDTEEIYKMLDKAADNFRASRDDLLGIGALEVGKTFLELDPEITEAIDFIEFYPHSLRALKKKHPNTSFNPKGIGAVIAPWNFPVGISVGTIAAPLAAGNRVIYKPSSLSIATGYMLCKCFWDAGIPKDALIFLPAGGKDISTHLLKDENIKFCVLTGGEDTGAAILEANPKIALSAETGGKNATIVTKLADRDQAVKNITHSAFSNSGQKCSATSLLILEEEVYNDEGFKTALVDAAKSLNVGDPFEFKNKVAALTDKISPKQRKALDELEDGESWALKPSFINNNEYLMTPGIKYGVKKGNFTYENELFFPLLSVMSAKNLKEAVELANDTGYGLTGGLESLDKREWEYYSKHIEIGNAYINKPTTGAIVLRQPFGGIKKSAIGHGRKVGIYNYVTQFLNIDQKKADSNPKTSNFNFTPLDKNYKDDKKTLQDIADSYIYYYENEFSKAKDYVNIRGEDNLFSYRPIKNMGYFVDKNDNLTSILGLIIAANISHIPIHIFYEDNKHMDFITQHLSECNLQAEITKSNAEEFIKKIPDFERIFYFGEHVEIFKAAAKVYKVVVKDRPLLNGRFYLLLLHNESSLSVSFHRYGNLGERIRG